MSNFEIKEHLAVLSDNTNNGKQKELNIVEWYGRGAKLDLREWEGDHEKAGKGITLTKEEAAELRESLNQLEL